RRARSSTSPVGPKTTFSRIEPGQRAAACRGGVWLTSRVPCAYSGRGLSRAALRLLLGRPHDGRGVCPRFVQGLCGFMPKDAIVQGDRASESESIAVARRVLATEIDGLRALIDGLDER